MKELTKINKQKSLPAACLSGRQGRQGVSLIITLFIMTIILSVVMAISTILYSEIKLIRNIGNSVVSFFAADSGMEKVLYYDRKVIPEGAVRGICNICTTGVCPDCNCSTPVGTGCADCTNCHIAFTTTINQIEEKSYRVDAHVSLLSQTPCPLSEGDAESYGIYKNTTRAVQVNITREVKSSLGPSITNAVAVISPNGKITISATVNPYGQDVTVTAYIYKQDGTFVDTQGLTAQGQGNYSHPWQGIGGETYYISIAAIDANSGYCASVTITPG